MQTQECKRGPRFPLLDQKALFASHSPIYTTNSPQEKANTWLLLISSYSKNAKKKTHKTSMFGAANSAHSLQNLSLLHEKHATKITKDAPLNYFFHGTQFRHLYRPARATNTPKNANHLKPNSDKNTIHACLSCADCLCSPSAIIQPN